MSKLTEGEQMIVDTAPDDLAHGLEVGKHRFTMFTKTENYAYARGLEVSPAHLPLALDAMLVDGWELVSLFGQTDAKNVGFIFRWVGTPKRIQDLLESNTKLTLANRALRTWAKRAIEQFAFYAKSHRAKGTTDATAKAVVNDNMVSSGLEALGGD
jgi:hypothetical protein